MLMDTQELRIVLFEYNQIVNLSRSLGVQSPFPEPILVELSLGRVALANCTNSNRRDPPQRGEASKRPTFLRKQKTARIRSACETINHNFTNLNLLCSDSLSGLHLCLAEANIGDSFYLVFTTSARASFVSKFVAFPITGAQSAHAYFSNDTRESLFPPREGSIRHKCHRHKSTSIEAFRPGQSGKW